MSKKAKKTEKENNTLEMPEKFNAGELDLTLPENKSKTKKDAEMIRRIREATRVVNSQGEIRMEKRSIQAKEMVMARMKEMRRLM